MLLVIAENSQDPASEPEPRQLVGPLSVRSVFSAEDAFALRQPAAAAPAQEATPSDTVPSAVSADTATQDAFAHHPSEAPQATVQEGLRPEALQWARFSFSTPQGESLDATGEVAIPYQPECTWEPSDLTAQLVIVVDAQGEVVYLSFDDSSLIPALQPAVRAALVRARFPPDPWNTHRRLRASIQFAVPGGDPTATACP